MKNDTILIMPAYNEDMNIGHVLQSLYDAGFGDKMDILVIDDGSADQTAKVARENGAMVISQCFNMGYGAALQTGYKYAAERDYKYLLQMDADGQHDVENLNVIMRRLKGEAEPYDPADRGKIPDIIIGSRFLHGSQSFAISGLKKIAIGMFRTVIRQVTGYALTDPTSGLQGLNREAFTYYAKFRQFDIVYPDLNMILQMLLLGYHIEEIPAIMHERTAGVSMHAGFWKPIKYMLVM